MYSCVFIPVEKLDQQITYRRRIADLYIPTIEADMLRSSLLSEPECLTVQREQHSFGERTLTDECQYI